MKYIIEGASLTLERISNDEFRAKTDGIPNEFKDLYVVFVGGTITLTLPPVIVDAVKAT